MHATSRLLTLGLAGLFVTACAYAQGGKAASAAPKLRDVDERALALSYVPGEAIAAGVLHEGDRRIADLRSWLESGQFEQTELYRLLMDDAQFDQARVGLLGLSAAARTDPWSALGAALGRDAALALALGGGAGPEVLYVSIPRTPELLDRLLLSIHALAGLNPEGKPDPKRTHQVGETMVYSFAPRLHECRIDDALLISNSRELIGRAVEARRSGNSVLRSKLYQRAAQQPPADAAFWTFADLQRLRALAEKRRELIAQIDNPLGGLLFGGWWHTLLSTNVPIAWLNVEPDGLVLEAVAQPAEAAPPACRGFRPELAAEAWSAQALPRFVGAIELPRGWADLFAEREQLLTLPAAGQLVNFSTVTSTLLGGIDFLNDVLPRVNGAARFIAARQEYSGPNPPPSPRLPAFALVVPIRTDPAFRERLFSGAISALSLVNLDMAQKGQPTYVLDLDKYRGERMVVARFAEPDAALSMDMGALPVSLAEGDAGPASAPAQSSGIRYNFAPAAAVVKDHAIIATSLDIMHDVMDALLDDGPAAADEKAAPSAGSDQLTLDVPSLNTLLRENHNELVLNRMLEQDLPRERAGQDIDRLLLALDFFKQLEIRSAPLEHGYRATLRLSLTPQTAWKRVP